jgi:hypothetical protein
LYALLELSPLGIDRFDLEDTVTGNRVVVRGFPQYRFDIGVAYRSSSGDGQFFLIARSPGEQVMQDTEDAASWAQAEMYFEEWLVFLQRELSASDPWAELDALRAIESPDLRPGYDNSPFTLEEQAAIEKGLDELQAHVLDQAELSASQIERLETNVSYLKDALKRLGRTDYRTAYFGVMATLVTEAMIPPDVLRHGMLIVARVTTHLFGVDLPGELGAG